MNYTQIAADAFKKIQLNAGVILKEFDPADPPATEQEKTAMRANILAATGGGVSFTAVPTFIDFGEDIDNVPENTMELKQLDRFDVTLSGTGKTADADFIKFLTAAADVSNGKVTPRTNLEAGDFQDLWWVGDYSDVTTGAGAGFVAIHIMNVLSSGGFSLQSNDKGKADFAFEFTAHYSLEDIDQVPFEVYVKDGEAADATLSSLAIGSVALSPSFSKNVTSYTASTSNASNTVTATATDSSATVVIKNGTTTVASGQSATWATGQNTLTVTVTNGGVSKVYTVTVTKA